MQGPMAESRVSAWAFRDGLRHRLHQRKIWIRAFAASRDENNRIRLVSEIGEIKNKKNFHFVGEKSFTHRFDCRLHKRKSVSLPASTSANRVYDKYAKRQRSLPQAHLWK